jgi:hypothetical protein
MFCWIVIKAFSSEVGTGSRKENASKQESEAERLQGAETTKFRRPILLLCRENPRFPRLASPAGMTDLPRTRGGVD